jgi:hypothetical protein
MAAPGTDRSSAAFPNSFLARARVTWPGLISTIDDDKAGAGKLNKISQPVEEKDRSCRGLNFFDPETRNSLKRWAAASSTSAASK